MKYRTEIDALNAILAEQQKTNELLEKLVKPTTNTTAKPTPIKDKTKRQYQRRNA